ncbi:MAG: hypothetical protein ACUZ8H_15785 [Candidatus Anammoxibacter sp.]
MKTKVIFYNAGDNEVFAFFPDELYDDGVNPNLHTSYSHVGQHSPCHIDYLNVCNLATKQESESLKAEMKQIGYDLK